MLVIKQFGPVTYAMGTLQEILAGTGIAAKVRALPNDVAGCTLEMGADGLWTGASVGTLTQAQSDALVASGALANVNVGTPATVHGQHVAWGGAGVGWLINAVGDPAWQVVGETPRIFEVSNAVAATSVDTRKAHYIDQDATVIRLMYSNAGPSIAVSVSEIEGAAVLSTITINATIEINGGCVPVSFSGSKKGILDPFGTLISDPIAIGPISAGSVFFSRTHATISGGGGKFCGIRGGFQGNEGVAYNGADITDSTGTAGYTTSTGDSFLCPRAILIPSSAGATLYLGDSITYGVGDNGLVVSPAPPQFSWTRRVAYGKFPCFVAGYPGATLKNFYAHLSPTLHQNICALKFNRAVISFGANDCQTFQGTSVIEMKNNFIYAIKKMRGLGISQVLISLILPRTTSTDNWATTANQTPVAGFGSGEARDQMNAWISSGCDGYADGAIDTLSLVSIGAMWLPSMTGDGIHPNTSAHAKIATTARVVLK